MLQNGCGDTNSNSISPICCFSADVFPYPGGSGYVQKTFLPRWDSQGLSSDFAGAFVLQEGCP